MSEVRLFAMTGTPFMTARKMADMIGISLQTLKERAKEMEQTGRYPKTAVSNDGGFLYINVICYQDYCHWRTYLQDKNLSKHVPPFNPAEIAWSNGMYQDKAEWEAV